MPDERNCGCGCNNGMFVDVEEMTAQSYSL